MIRPKILIPGGNPSELQLINAAHRMGMFVITSGNNKYAQAHQFADRYIPCDFSDKDALLSVAKANNIQYMCSNANDIALLSTTFVCEKLCLPGHDSYETSLKLHHKDKFKELANRLLLHVPEGKSFSSIESAIEYAKSLSHKFIVKPVDLVGGNGISTVEEESEIISAIQKASCSSLNGRIIIEQYIDGTAHSLSCFLVNKKVVSYFSDNEYVLGKPYKISTSASPATGFDRVRDILIHDAECVAQELDLVDGRLHMQYLLQGNTPYILEMTRRISGDLYSVPESYSLGFNTADWYLKAECGMDVSKIPHCKPQGMYGRHCITASRRGITDGIDIDEELDACVLKKWLWGAYNYNVTDCENDILGLLFFKFDTPQQIEDTIQSINGQIKIRFKK